ncbi:hypothetical protein QWJ90_00610 [Microbacterium oryzae]|uniref:hypothetical protein n=1 Tax=Microbacterium oryzae TaxID=743009 RepID=UPI0025B18C35|nr:hypothetical protein [Microbacterium oryzae]MDN3309429.1 hypothetical protein [Microbacterium oryzae]
MDLATAITTLAAESEHHGNVALETVHYGLVAFGVFGVLALIMASYRNVANRHIGADGHASSQADGAGH